MINDIKVINITYLLTIQPDEVIPTFERIIESSFPLNQEYSSFINPKGILLYRYSIFAHFS